MRMASIYYNGMFDIDDFKLPEKVKVKGEIPADTELNTSLRQFMDETDLVCSEIFFNSQQYKNGDLVVIEAVDTSTLKIGLIQYVLVKSGVVYFVVRRYVALKNYLGYFVTDQAHETPCCVNASHLADFKPLIMHGTTNKFKFALHHHVSFSYS